MCKVVWWLQKGNLKILKTVTENVWELCSHNFATLKQVSRGYSYFRSRAIDINIISSVSSILQNKCLTDPVYLVLLYKQPAD